MRNEETAASKQVHVVDHPLAQHKLSLMRDRSTGTTLFRALLRETGMLMAYAVTRDLPLASTPVETPLETMQAPTIAGKKLTLVSVLRAGNGLVDGFLEAIPAARVGHVGMQRDPQTLEAHEYYLKLPPAVDQRDLIVIDPMLATAHTAIATVDRLLAFRPRSMRFACLVAAPEGLERFHRHHPDVPIHTVAIDRQLNEKGYILPGLGDAGDRLYGT